MKARVLQYTGLPVSVGIASTKCLCKIANEIVKHDPSYEGVLDLTALPEEEVDTLLSRVAIADVWGIGRKYATFLQNHGIMTAKDLKYADEQWIRKYLTVTGHRIVLELRGISCMPLEIVRPTKKGIMCAKTFGQEIQEYTELVEAIACYVARVAEKLRSQDSQTAFLTVFVRTNYFNKSIPHYENSYSIRLPFATAFTPDLIESALKGLKAIFQDGLKYKKAGVMLSKITPLAHVCSLICLVMCHSSIPTGKPNSWLWWMRSTLSMAVTVFILPCKAAPDPGKCVSLNSLDALPLSGARYLRLKDSQSEHVSRALTEGPRASFRMRCLCPTWL